jgi:hypothetical protein
MLSLVVFKFFDLLFPCPYFCENIPPNKANSAQKLSESLRSVEGRLSSVDADQR